jgi:hypothetical protein
MPVTQRLSSGMAPRDRIRILMDLLGGGGGRWLFGR